MTDALVLSESDALDVLAYLITAARTQLDEAAEYGPLRLLGAARLLAQRLAPRASAPTATLLSAVDAFAPTATPRADRDAYVARLDQLCVAVADCLLAAQREPQ
jgi:Family of unknown function (DUF6092)